MAAHFPSSYTDWIAGGEWQYGENPADFARDLQQARQSLRAHQAGDSRHTTVLILSADPRTFILGATAAILESCNLILGSAEWGEATRKQLESLLPNGTIMWGQQWQTLHTEQPVTLHEEYAAFSPWIAIATGGTSGKLRLAVHNPQTLTAAALGLQRFMGNAPLNSVVSLPLHHVSGWMPLWRAWCSRGQVAMRDSLMGKPLSNPEQWLLSWVPTQLYRELQQPTSTIPNSRLRGILIGGAGLQEEIAAQARQRKWPLMPCYGMTETAALITALRSDSFLAGVPGYGSPLPHVRLHLSTEQELQIEADSLFFGYLGERPRTTAVFSPRDLAQWSAEGSLQIIGRSDYLINTGGEKVSPESVEAILLQSGLLEDAAVVGIQDAEWGERVVTLLQWKVDSGPHQQERLLQYLKQHLTSWQIPRQFIPVPHLPRNAAGKLQRTSLRALIPPQ